MPSTSKGDQSDAIRRYHAADDKARNERQKAILLQYLARLLTKVSSRLSEQSSRMAETLRRATEKASASRSLRERAAAARAGK